MKFIERCGLSAGHSLVIEDDVASALSELKQKNLITHQFAGGTTVTPCTTTLGARGRPFGAAGRHVQQY